MNNTTTHHSDLPSHSHSPPVTPAQPPAAQGLVEGVPGLDQAHSWAAAYLSPIRLEILLHLFTNGEQAVIAIADALELERSSISHALTKLRDDGLVDVRNVDRRRLYSMTDRVRVNYTDAAFTLNVTREDGWQIAIQKKMPTKLNKPSTECEPKPNLTVRPLAPKS